MTLGITVKLGTGALLLYGVPFIIVVGWFSSRILGVHRGWGRSLVAGFVGWIFGVVDRRRGPGPEHPEHRPAQQGPPPGVLHRSPRLDVRRPGPRHHPEAEGDGSGTDTGRSCTRSRTVKRKLAPLGRSREILALRPQARAHRVAVRVGREDGHAGVRAAAPADARGLRRHVREVRPDRLDAYRPAARGAHDRACPAAVVGPTRARRRGPRDGRVRARRDRRGGVRVVRLRAARGGVDRPDPSGGAQDRRAGGRQGAAARHRGRRAPRRRGAPHGRRASSNGEWKRRDRSV